MHTLGRFSAHADQTDLLNFVKRIGKPAKQVRFVRGYDRAKTTLKQAIRGFGTGIEVVIP